MADNYFSGTINLLSNLAAQQKAANLEKETPQYQQALFNLLQAKENAAFAQTMRQMLINAKNPTEILNILSRYGGDTQAAKELSSIEQAPIESYRKGVNERLKQVPDIYGDFVNPPAEAVGRYVYKGDITPFEGIPVRDKSMKIQIDPFERAKLTALGSAAGKASADLAGIEAIKNDINDVFASFNRIPNTFRGPIAGRTVGQIGKAGANDDVVTYENTKELTLSNIAKKLGGEVGVLTDRDIARISDALPALKDTPQQANNKVKFILNYIDRRIKAKQKVANMTPTGLKLDKNIYDNNFKLPDSTETIPVILTPEEEYLKSMGLDY